jgi:hypothetical protein
VGTGDRRRRVLARLPEQLLRTLLAISLALVYVLQAAT